ncbi:MAG: hypothetical protein QF404_09885 [Planctomycetota bacterium]|nr:hypothetical protein [Planctomycetota bacterium]MDP6937968.1 hypothetical protein [Planctomycetota bacterium]
MQRPRWAGEKPTSPRRGRWSAEEVARFKDLFGLKDESVVARELCRSVASVRKMAQTVYGRPHRVGPWSAAEIQELKRYLGATDVDTVALVLARPREEVQAQIVELARVKTSGPWARDDIAEFKRIYGTRSDEDLTLIFGRSLVEVGALATKLHLAKDKAFLRTRQVERGVTKMPRWKPSELDILRELYPVRPNLEIAEHLNRSVKSVVSKAHNLGLRKNPDRLREMGRQNVGLRYRPASQDS